MPLSKRERQSSTTGSLHLAIEPCPRISPIAFGGGDGNSQNLGGFLQGQAYEVTKLDQFCFGRVMICQSIQGIIHCQQLFIRSAADNLTFGELDTFLTAAVALGGFAARLINKNATHGLRRRGEEMDAVLPVLIGAAYPKPRLMHERGRLQSLPGRLARQLAGRDSSQLIVDRGQQFFRTRLASLNTTLNAG